LGSFEKAALYVAVVCRLIKTAGLPTSVTLQVADEFCGILVAENREKLTFYEKIEGFSGLRRSGKSMTYMATVVVPVFNRFCRG
jgi:hypothetical protein